MAKSLLERDDVDPNLPDKLHRTPLRCAARKGHDRVVELLLGRGDFDPNCLDKYDETPLWWAATKGHDGVVKLLLGREDVDPNLSDKYDRTPLSPVAQMTMVKHRSGMLLPRDMMQWSSYC